MQREFLQEKSLSRLQGNAEKSLNVDLSAKSRLIPYSTTAGMLGLNDLYIEERDACENYRMIFTVNPICTNVIYNAITEPVYKEGSDSAITLIETAVPLDNRNVFPDGTISNSGGSVNQIYAVRNTEFSHERIGDFKYHCGYDIFNNHLLRTKDFDHAKIEGSSTPANKKEFNSIFDFAIDYSGQTVQRDISDSEGPVKDGILKREPIRMYQLDNINSINTAFYENLRTVDGWYGFYNTGYINIPNGKLKDNSEVCVNRILNNETSCGFIDLYPDRSLYSFIPKVNRYRKRLERNWDCTIVYPYKSDYDTFNKVMLNITDEEKWGRVSDTLKPYAVRVLGAYVKYNNVGDEVIEIHSLLRHTLVPGDEIRLFYAAKDDSEPVGYKEIGRLSVPVRVINVGDVNGDNENRCFTIKFSDIATFAEIIETEDGKKLIIKKRKNDSETPAALLFFYKKIVNGYDNKYYFRRFKKLINYEYYNCNSANTSEEKMREIKANAVRLVREPSIIDENNPKYILLGDEYFEKISRPLTYTQNKIAFAENIFGDRVAQVIFNDDICISGLKDNLGRPLSTVYFTAVKTNRGHKDWYEEGNITADTVEYSHCFGEVTSGLDLPDDSGSTEYNVRKLYNVFKEECDPNYSTGLEIALSGAPNGSYNGTPMPLESGITLDEFDEFFGDIVEFSKADFRETIIEKVYHRFNTAQRECLLNTKYYNVNYDELDGDLYDVDKIDNE